ncbi:hypothetical protein cand_015150 [Cryptosporidium andersoni]|uniref:Uncharacterized protein n=1 Tax=Cryptosporidium andersoni TaxID=117008 RepID=A0A1J4MW47_9CRYT|nr:hypothetical protein cand_015150 [Cryptosporidium andersoni]
MNIELGLTDSLSWQVTNRTFHHPFSCFQLLDNSLMFALTSKNKLLLQKGSNATILCVTLVKNSKYNISKNIATNSTIDLKFPIGSLQLPHTPITGRFFGKMNFEIYLSHCSRGLVSFYLANTKLSLLEPFIILKCMDTTLLQDSQSSDIQKKSTWSFKERPYSCTYISLENVLQWSCISKVEGAEFQINKEIQNILIPESHVLQDTILGNFVIIGESFILKSGCEGEILSIKHSSKLAISEELIRIRCDDGGKKRMAEKVAYAVMLANSGKDENKGYSETRPNFSASV